MFYFALTAENAEEFYRRCIHKEAITPEERLAVMKEMAEEKRLLAAGPVEGKMAEALTEFFDKTKHRGVIGIKRKEGTNEA